MEKLARLIAFYLPQFHPIPENNEWWGPGFTEWTNVAKAKPMFRGHYQPHIPADLGFYDLRVPETRIAQAKMAKEYGIEAFCYFHYWFAGKRLLERVFNEVLKSGEPDFPFCLCWANHSWMGIWSGCPDRTLIEQTYPGFNDYQAHFETLLPAFQDKRYLKVDGKPLFVIYQPMKIPEVNKVTSLWRNLAAKSGLGDLHLVGVTGSPDWNPKKYGFDASMPHDNLPRLRGWVSKRTPIRWLINEYPKWMGRPTIYLYKRILSEWLKDDSINMTDYPLLIPNWDNTPRSGSNGLVLHGSTPELFRIILRKSIVSVQHKPTQYRIIFVKSWNEWAEGNYLEPDLKFGKGYLEVIKGEIFRETSDEKVLSHGSK
jgi:hypothetical protein